MVAEAEEAVVAEALVVDARAYGTPITLNNHHTLVRCTAFSWGVFLLDLYVSGHLLGVFFLEKCYNCVNTKGKMLPAVILSRNTISQGNQDSPSYAYLKLYAHYRHQPILHPQRPTFELFCH